MKPTGGPTAGGTDITLTGENFGSTNARVNIRIGNLDCPIKFNTTEKLVLPINIKLLL